MNIPKEALDAARTTLDKQEVLHCTRALEAWQHGTMTEDDFTLVTYDDEAVEEIVNTILEAAMPHIREQLATEIEERVRTSTELPERIQHKALAMAISTAVDQGMKLAARIIRRKDIQ